MTFASHGTDAKDFSNLRENALIRVEFALPPNFRLIDPATNALSDETLVDVWRMVPSVNNVALTGPDGVNPWPRDPNRSGGYQLDARFDSLQDQALGALLAHAEIQNPPQQRCWTILPRSSACCSRANGCVRFPRRSAAGRLPVPDPEPRLNALEQQGKAVFLRSCGQCHGGAGQSTTQAPVVRYHDISSQCPRPVDTAVPARFNFRPCPARLARNARTYEITLPNGSIDPPNHLGSRPRPADWIRRARTTRRRRLEQARYSRPARNSQHRAVLPQQQRRHARRRRRSLFRILQACAGDCSTRRRPARAVHRRRALRPRATARGASRAARLLAQDSNYRKCR